MKNFTLLSFLCFAFTFSASAQYGLNAIGIGAVDYVEIEANPNGSLDVTDGFTFEAWIFNQGGTSNQKVGGKLAADFKNGFIYGIQDLQVNFEVFDDAGNNTVVLAGEISPIGWTHVAGTYEVGGMSRVFINGELAGETAASIFAVNPNTNPFRVGIAPWDINALGFVGYVDEVRYWQAALSEETIKKWMHRDINADHENFDKLGLYHKYNETEGTVAMDESGNENWGIFSSEFELSDVGLPFMGTFDLYENDVQGIWNAKQTATSGILSIEGTFFDTLEVENSVLLSNSDGDYSFTGGAPDGYDGILSKKWRVATQGELFSNLTFDLSPVDLTNVTDVVLLVSPTEDFSSADIITGNLDGNTLTYQEEILTDGTYYTLGFVGVTSDHEETIETSTLKVFPNPTTDFLRVEIKTAETEGIQMILRNALGQPLWVRSLTPIAGHIQEQLDLSQIPSGIYFIEIKGTSSSNTEKIIRE